MSLIPMPDFWKWVFGVTLLVASLACFVKPHYLRKNSGTCDVWLKDAVFYAVRGRWLTEAESAFTEEGQFERASQVAQEVRQFARDGRLAIFGKEWENSTFDPISHDYWASNQISFLDMLRADPADTRTETATFESKGPIYKQLRANRAEFEIDLATQEKEAQRIGVTVTTSTNHPD